MKEYLYCLWSGVRAKPEIYSMLAKITAIANIERKKGNPEHAALMTAVGVGLRWVIHDYDFGLEELSKPREDRPVQGSAPEA